MNREISDPYLQKIAEACKRYKIPSINQATGEVLSLFTFLTRPRRILEIGTGCGYSTVFLARMLTNRCTIVSIEKDKRVYKIAQKIITELPYASSIKLINADAITWLKLTKSKYDFIFVDGKKREYHRYLQICSRLLKHGGMIVFDDTLFWMNRKPKSVKRSLKDIYLLLLEKRLKYYFRDFNRKLLRNPEFEVFIVSIGNGLTVCIKQ